MTVTEPFNTVMLEVFPGQIQEFCTADSVGQEGVDGLEISYPAERIQSLTPPGLPLGQLK